MFYRSFNWLFHERICMRFKSTILILFLLLFGNVGSAFATNYTLWIHGRTSSGSPGSTGLNGYGDFSYWGPASKISVPGQLNVAVNWDGKSSIANTNVVIRSALDRFCTGDNWCTIASHSAGNLQIGYALAHYGSSDRLVRDAYLTSSGWVFVTPADGIRYQKGWNIHWVDVAGGAAGGSELSDAARVGSNLSWVPGLGSFSALLSAVFGISDIVFINGLLNDLRPANARNLYDHNQTQGKTFYMYLGARTTGFGGSMLNVFRAGDNDGAVAYHSSGGVSAAKRFCNNGAQRCEDIRYGIQNAEDGTKKWANHHVQRMDLGQKLDHFQGGNWLGVISGMVEDHLLK
jgi:hypothetical protein